MTENRSSQRFVLRNPVPASIGGAAATVLNISSSGLHVEHAQPLGGGFRVGIVMQVGGWSAAFPGEIAWSRSSRTSRDEICYRSGIRVVGGDLQGLIAALRAAGQLEE